MSLKLVPDYSFPSITDVSYDFLVNNNITFLLADLDNTIAPYGKSQPAVAVLKWAEDLRNNGITLFIISNNTKSRPADFARVFNINHIKRAKKPSRQGVLRALELSGKKIEETAIVGDQIFTDVYAGNRAGVMSILVSPISLKNPLLAIRYLFELPFRCMCKSKFKKGKFNE